MSIGSPRRRPVPWDPPEPKMDGTEPRDGSMLCCRVNGNKLDLAQCGCTFKMCDDCIVYNFKIPSSIWQHPINANADVHFKFDPSCAGLAMKGTEKRNDVKSTMGTSRS